MTKSAMIERAREFLAERRIAVVGVSRDEKAFSRFLLRELIRRGYDVVPVSAHLREVEGRACFRRATEIEPPASAALLLTRPERTEEAVRDAISAGIDKIWMHRGQGAGAASPAAVEACVAHHIALVTDLCPLMVLPDSGWPHRVHRFFRRRMRSAPPGEPTRRA